MDMDIILGVNKVKEIIKLDTFRGFESLDNSIDTDGDIVLITGPNGSGKSSILYALHCTLNGYFKEGMLDENIVGEMAKTGYKGCCQVKYYDKKLEVKTSNDIEISSMKEYRWDNDEKNCNLILQERATAVYQDLIVDPRINEFVDNLIENFSSELKIDDKLKDTVNSLEQEIKNRYLHDEKEFLHEERKRLIKRFTETINRTRHYRISVPQSIANLDFRDKGNWEETYETLRDFMRKIEYELDIEENESSDQIPQSVLRRIEKAFSIMIDRCEEEQKKNERIESSQDQIDEFFKARAIDSRSLEIASDAKTLEGIRPYTVLLFKTNDVSDTVKELSDECLKKIMSIQKQVAVNERRKAAISTSEKKSEPFDFILKSIENYG